LSSPRRLAIRFEHRIIDRHGPDREAVSGGIGDNHGWPIYLNRRLQARALITRARLTTSLGGWPKTSVNDDVVPPLLDPRLKRAWLSPQVAVLS
jgi:hypothetical protein